MISVICPNICCILGLDYIKEHLEEANGSSTSDEDDLFSTMSTTHGQETVKQLEGYLASKVDNKDTEIVSFGLQIVS
jgi:hypothetical protein